MKFSELASPPITPTEAELADHSICPNHGGKPSMGAWFQEGRVYYCPLGRQFWRYGGKRGGMYAPLPYGRTGIV